MAVEIITEAKPHTIKKFELITKYVDAWSRKILGNPKSQGVVFIDCMSNSGYYKDVNENIVEGTPIRVAKLLNDIIINYPGKSAWLYFNDIAPNRVSYLKTEIEKLNLKNINVHFDVSDCNAYLKAYDTHKHRNVNTLLIYDPYEASIDWDAIEPFFHTWGEVIVNHMIYDTKRGAINATKESTINKYKNTYHKTLEELLSLGGNSEKLNEIIIDLIKEQTTDSKREHFIAPVPFYNRNNGQVYYLIHCCSNIAGIKLFKNTAWKTFCDKSSNKGMHGDELQMCLDLDGEGTCSTTTDESCYCVQDIAKYIYSKYHERGAVEIDEIYNDLDRHPIFPSEGYKTEIIRELKELYGVTVKGNSPKTIVFH